MPRRRDPDPPPALFVAQWADRRLERAMGGAPVSGACRLCACTDYSACIGGCSWAEPGLCSSCAELMKAFPVLRFADGYGDAAWCTAVEKLARECEEDFEHVWVCGGCDLVVVSPSCCPRCGTAPPWGCDCARHAPEPDFLDSLADMFEEFESERPIP